VSDGWISRWHCSYNLSIVLETVKKKSGQTYINYSQRIDRLGYIPLKLVKTWFFDKHGVDIAFEFFVFLLWMVWSYLMCIMNFFTMVQEILNRKDLTMSHQPFNSGYE
jgi:hypothetical protein